MEKSKLFVFFKVKNLKTCYVVNNVLHQTLIDGYIDMNLKFALIQNTITGTVKLSYLTGPKYCSGSDLKFSKHIVYEKHKIPKKYQKYYEKLRLLYNNHLEELSKETNKSYILI